MKRCFFCLLFLLLFFHPLAAQEKKPVPMPDPSNLEAGWWRYLQEEKTFDANTDKLLAKLTELRKEVDIKKSPILANELELVILAIKDLKNFKQEKIQYKPTHPLFLNTYFLSDWLTITDRIRGLELKKKRIEAINLKIQANRDLIRQNLDLYQIHYSVFAGAPAQKMVLGLEIMRMRIEFEQATIRLKRNQEHIKLIDKDLVKLREEKQYAQDHLSLENLTVDHQKKKVEEAEAIFQDALKNLVATKQEKVNAELPKELANMKAQLATIQTELAYAKVLFEKILLELARQVKKDENVTTRIDVLEKQLNIISNKVKSWEGVVQVSSPPPGKGSEAMLETAHKIETALAELKSILSNGELLIDEFEDKIEEKSPWHTRVFLQVWNALVNTFVFFSGIGSFILFHINDYPVTLWSIIRAFLIIFIAVVGGRMVTNYIRAQQAMKRKVGKSNLYTISKIAYYLLVLVGILAAFFSIGFDMTNFVIIGGALGVGIGLGMQSIANNFFAGIILLFEKRIRVGDIIELDKQEMGTVQSINIQNTTIRTFDGREVVVPNSDFTTKRLTNWTMNDNYLRLQIPFGVAYGSNVELVKEAVIDAAKLCHLTVLNEKICPPPIVWMKEFADSSLNFELIVWVDLSRELSKSGLYSHYLILIEKTLRDNGIVVPFPQRDLWVKQIPTD